MRSDFSSSVVGSGRANEVMLKQLGEATISASRLEHLAAELGRRLKIEAGVRHAITALQSPEITPPPWSTINAKDITSWASSSWRLLEIRERIFEACGSSRFAGSRGDTIATESADGTVFPADEEYLARYLKRLERQLAAGVELESRLDYHDESGQRWPLVSLYARRAAGEGEEPTLKLPVEWQNWLSA